MIHDLETSTIVLAGRRFPAVGIICPPMEGVDETRGQRLLGGPGRQPNPAQIPGPRSEVYVPCENKLLIEVGQNEQHLSIALYARTCYRYDYHGNNETPLWLPHRLVTHAGQIMRETKNWHDSYHSWNQASEDWMCEHIDRLSKMRYDEPEGPEVELIPLAETWRLMLEEVQ